MLQNAKSLLLAVALSSFIAGCNSWTTPAGAGDDAGAADGNDAGTAAPIVYPPDPAGLHVVGNHIMDAAGDRLFLRGVNRSGTEYECSNGFGIFDGPSDEASIQAMTTWNINAVRVPLNESCWLGINGVSSAFGGDKYKAAILGYVNLLHKYHLVPILELHWTAPGSALASGQEPMPDADHAPAFWTDVATTFVADTGVVFELFNEPYPDSNRDTGDAWTCWRDGCSITISDTGLTYQATGMQPLVTAVRATGATQLILLGGVEYSNSLSQWFSHMPVDPAQNVAPAWHIYNNNECSSTDCWSSVLSEPMALGTQLPIVATEIGENDCGNTFINPLMQLLDTYASGYLAWSWNASQDCVAATPPTKTSPGSAGHPYPLITDYTSGTPPSDYAHAFMDHLAAVSP